MKHLSPLLLIAFNITLCFAFSFTLTGCGDSSYSKKGSTVTTVNPADPVTPYSPDDPRHPNYVSNHCSDIDGQENLFYGYMKNVLNKGSYQDLIESQTDCKSYNGWVTYRNGNSVYQQYEQYSGVATCAWWNKQPMGISIGFFKGYKNTATIAIDATGDGWAYSGQGFPVRRMVFNGQIDCSQKDLTIHSQTSKGWLSLIVEKEYGNKNTPTLRVNVMFNGVSLGKQQLRRLQ